MRQSARGEGEEKGARPRAASRSGGRLGPRPRADEAARIGPRPKTDQAAGWGRGRGRTGFPFLQVSITTGVVITVGLR